VTEQVFSSVKKLTTNRTGNRIVVGFLVAFLIIGTAEFFSADVAEIGVAVSVGVQSSNSPSVEPNILPEDPETRILYLRDWNTIQTQENSGNHVQDFVLE
jgi:hypothetical protein